MWTFYASQSLLSFKTPSSRVENWIILSLCKRVWTKVAEIRRVCKVWRDLWAISLNASKKSTILCSRRPLNTSSRRPLNTNLLLQFASTRLLNTNNRCPSSPLPAFLLFLSKITTETPSLKAISSIKIPPSLKPPSPNKPKRITFSPSNQKTRGHTLKNPSKLQNLLNMNPFTSNLLKEACTLHFNCRMII